MLDCNKKIINSDSIVNSMRRVSAVHLRGKSWVSEIVPVESLLHSLVWRAFHSGVGVAGDGRMHGMLHVVVYVSIARIVGRGCQRRHGRQTRVGILGRIR